MFASCLLFRYEYESKPPDYCLRVGRSWSAEIGLFFRLSEPPDLASAIREI